MQNCDIKFQNFQRAITQKNHMNFFKISPDNLLIVLYQLLKVPSLYLGGGGGGRVGSGVRGSGLGGGGGQGRCERRSEVFVKIKKIFFF